MLKSVYLGFSKVKVQRVTVVEFGMYNRSGDGVGCLRRLLRTYLIIIAYLLSLIHI